ncbi:MAG: hypothetical protein ACTS6A_01250 [Candidatus Hodgkinia cicadicola]
MACSVALAPFAGQLICFDDSASAITTEVVNLPKRQVTSVSWKRSLFV